MKTLTPREAAEKAKEIVKADSDLDESAQLFYNKKAENRDEEIGLRIVLGTQTVTRAGTLSWVTVLNGVNAANPGSLMYYLEGPINLNVVDCIRNQRDRNQPSIIKILDQEVESENKQDLEDKKLSIFLEDLGELYDDDRKIPDDELEELCEILERLDTVKQLECEVRKLREGRAPFTNIAPLAHTK